MSAYKNTHSTLPEYMKEIPPLDDRYADAVAAAEEHAAPGALQDSTASSASAAPPEEAVADMMRQAGDAARRQHARARTPKRVRVPSVKLGAQADGKTAVPAEEEEELLLDDADDIFAEPDAPDLVEGLLPERGVVFVYGASGTGKSFVNLHIAHQIASGGAVFGHEVLSPKSVLYIYLEGPGGLKKRLRAFEAGTGDQYSRDVKFLKHKADGAESVWNLEADWRRTAKACRKHGIQVVIVDTFMKAVAGSEKNDGAQMGAAVERLHALAEEIGGLVIVTHHSGKDLARGMAGSQQIHDAADGVISVKRSGDVRTLTVEKARDGDDGRSYAFTLRRVEYGPPNERGIAPASCVLEEQGRAAPRESKPHCGPTEERILLRTSIEQDKAAGPVARKVVTDALVAAKMEEQGPGAKRKNVADGVSRAFERCVNKGWLEDTGNGYRLTAAGRAEIV